MKTILYTMKIWLVLTKIRKQPKQADQLPKAIKSASALKEINPHVAKKEAQDKIQIIRVESEKLKQ